MRYAFPDPSTPVPVLSPQSTHLSELSQSLVPSPGHRAVPDCSAQSGSREHLLAKQPSKGRPCFRPPPRSVCERSLGKGFSPILLGQIGLHIEEEALALLDLVLQLPCSLLGIRLKGGFASAGGQKLESEQGAPRCPQPTPVGQKGKQGPARGDTTPGTLRGQCQLSPNPRSDSHSPALGQGGTGAMGGGGGS